MGCVNPIPYAEAVALGCILAMFGEQQSPLMSDNLKNRGEPDRSLFNSNEPWEWANELEKLKKAFPKCTEGEIKFAISTCVKMLQVTQKSESRAELEGCAAESLTALSRNRK